MKKEDIDSNLNNALRRFNMDAAQWEDYVSKFRKKLYRLFEAKSFTKLLRALLSSNDLNEFNSYVFEVLFAYDFHSKREALLYEIKQLTDNQTSVDFCYKGDHQVTINFKLRLISQRKYITDSIQEQLNCSKSFEIILNGKDEQKDTVRLQTLLLSKCQKDDGTPVKFGKPEKSTYNFIVANLSELHLGMVDKCDCLLAMYGDKDVPFYCQRGIFGMWQSIADNSSEKERELYNRFGHFRNTINGVVFVRYVKHSGFLERLYVDRELEYFLITNENLMNKDEANFIEKKLYSFLKTWKEDGYQRLQPDAELA